MALPVIAFNNSTGSDVAASGAGPATALTGTNASTSADGLTVTLPNADLTNVAVDGSHVVWLDTASGRQFSKITAKANSGTPTAQVTVANAYGASLSGQTYAIGGKRATIADADSKKLFTADLLSGWTVNIEETGTDYDLGSGGLLISLAIGDTTDGPARIISTSATKPKLYYNGSTYSNAAAMFALTGASKWLFENLVLERQGASFHASIIASTASNNLSLVVRNCTFRATTGSDTGATVNGIQLDQNASGIFLKVVNCLFESLGGSAVTKTSGIQNNGGFSILGCRLKSINSAGFNVGNCRGLTIAGCVIHGGASDGILLSLQSRAAVILGNIIHGNTGDGIDANIAGAENLLIRNNIITSNAGYGINVSAAVPDDLYEADYNAFRANTSGARNNIAAGDNDVTLTADPYVNAAAFDFNINNAAGGGAALRAVSRTMP